MNKSSCDVFLRKEWNFIMAIDVIILPLKGLLLPVGKYNQTERAFHFGMTQDEIAQAHGEPAKYEVSHLVKMVYEPRRGMTLTYEYESFAKRHEPRLFAIEMTVGKGVGVLYEGMNLLEGKTEEVIEFLKKYDENPTPDNGKFMMFYELGILLGGYGRKRVPEKRLIQIFPKEKQAYYEMMFRTGGGKYESQ
jgi:hypothetical protein